MRLVHYSPYTPEYYDSPRLLIATSRCGTELWVTAEKKRAWRNKYSKSEKRWSQVYAKYTGMPVLKKGGITPDMREVTCLQCLVSSKP